MISTIHPSAKIATPTQAGLLEKDFNRMSYSARAKFGDDVNTYIASKGYDGARWHNNDTPYITMFNKSALIFYAGVADG